MIPIKLSGHTLKLTSYHFFLNLLHVQVLLNKLQTFGSEREAVWELIRNKNNTFLLGDKGYLSARFKSDLNSEQTIKLETPVRHNMVDHLARTERNFLKKTRRLVER